MVALLLGAVDLLIGLHVIETLRVVLPLEESLALGVDIATVHRVVEDSHDRASMPAGSCRTGDAARVEVTRNLHTALPGQTLARKLHRLSLFHGCSHFNFMLAARLFMKLAHH
jgi:hypothetical protein